MIEVAVARSLLPLALVASLCGPSRAQDSDKVRDTVKRLEAVLSEVDARLAGASAAQTEVEALRADNVTLRQQLTVAATQLQQRAREIEATRKDLAAARTDLAANARTVADLQQQKEEGRLRAEELAAKVQRLEQRAQVDTDEQKQRLAQAVLLASAREAELTAVRAELATARDAAKGAEQVARDRAKHEQELDKRSAANAREIDALKTAAADQARRAGEAMRERDAARAQLTDAERDKTALAHDLEAKLRATHDTAEVHGAESAAALTQIRALTEDVHRLRTQLEAARAAPPARDDGPPVQIHHHGSGNIILQIPARSARVEVDAAPSEADDPRPRRIDE